MDAEKMARTRDSSKLRDLQLRPPAAQTVN